MRTTTTRERCYCGATDCPRCSPSQASDRREREANERDEYVDAADRDDDGTLYDDRAYDGVCL